MPVLVVMQAGCTQARSVHLGYLKVAFDAFTCRNLVGVTNPFEYCLGEGLEFGSPDLFEKGRIDCRFELLEKNRNSTFKIVQQWSQLLKHIRNSFRQYQHQISFVNSFSWLQKTSKGKKKS